MSDLMKPLIAAVAERLGVPFTGLWLTAPVEVLMELYRGQRIGTGAGRIDFDFGDGYVVWNVGDRLVARPTAGGDAVELLAEGYEVFLGFQPGDGAAVVRVRTRSVTTTAVRATGWWSRSLSKESARMD